MNEFNELESKKVIDLQEVKIGVEYAIVLTTSAGLWRYIIGDTIRFTSIYPYRFQVTGRTTHFINAFGEKTIISHVERALSKAANENNLLIFDFTVAPYFEESKGSGGHQWLIAIDSKQKNQLNKFEDAIDANMKSLNVDYDGKRKGSINMMAPKFTYVQKDVFELWLKKKNKLGGQHKVPRVQNDRIFIEELIEIENKASRLP